MDFIKSILGLVGAGVIFVVSVFLILTGLLVLNPQVHAFVIHLVSIIHPVLTIALGVVLFFVSFFLFLLAGKHPDAAGAYTFEGDKGPIEISLRALEDYIAKHFAEKPVVHSVRTRAGVSSDRKQIRVRASISVWSEQSFKTAGENVQQEIKQCLKKGFGLDNVENVHVSVDKIIASKKSKKAAPRPAPISPPAEKPEKAETPKAVTPPEET